MKIGKLCAGASLSLCVALALGAGCAGDDKKIASRDGGAGGQAGEGLAGDGPSSGGSQSSGASSGSSAGGAAGESGVAGEPGVAGESGGGTNAGGDGGSGTGVGGEASGGGGSASSGDAGAGGVATSEPTPVPGQCIGCASDFCVASRSACQNDATCVSCRDVDYTAPACGQNAAFNAWIACICATGCAGACASVCP